MELEKYVEICWAPVSVLIVLFFIGTILGATFGSIVISSRGGSTFYLYGLINGLLMITAIGMLAWTSQRAIRREVAPGDIFRCGMAVGGTVTVVCSIIAALEFAISSNNPFTSISQNFGPAIAFVSILMLVGAIGAGVITTLISSEYIVQKIKTIKP